MPLLHPRIHTTIDVGNPPSSPDESRYKSIQIHFHGFAYLPHARGRGIISPRFSMNGHQWELGVYPGGELHARHTPRSSTYLAIYIRLCSQGSVTASFDVKLLNKFGDLACRMRSPAINWRSDMITEWSWPQVMRRSKVLDENRYILDDDGTLAIVVSTKEDATAAFVPKNPLTKMMKGMFNDETTADVCFEVCSAEGKDDDDGTKRAKTSTSFYAHRSILCGCAPMLAALFDVEDTGPMISAQISDVKPDIFQYMLGYVYGGSVPKEELMTHAKDIINAADKYSIVNLKLEAEAVYLNSTIFTVDNAMDNLLYADAKNCALLKETVLDFLAENSKEAINNISFADFPGSVVKDLMIAFDRSKKRILQEHCSDSEGEDNDDDDGEDYSLMRVSELRRKLDGKGLDVDGSREAMIEALKNSTALSYAHDATD
uniref:BTB domain-containing protein n=1 Tax=Skeletonema marinoi TaxID=267567 RepID=A0A7S2KS34_9STRA|mmetsp:Transcript_16181/g.27338  ORF Transcript_16181/g.27338 Transcript_16181/m.27338 type:complete len:431 (+) Transcript_16181:105-1397(+)